jgi:hypothetical protein
MEGKKWPGINDVRDGKPIPKVSASMQDFIDKFSPDREKLCAYSNTQLCFITCDECAAIYKKKGGENGR